MAGIIVGYLPIFFIDEVWDLVARSSCSRSRCISALLGFVTLLYLYVEVQRRLGATDQAFARARPDLPARARSRPPASAWS